MEMGPTEGAGPAFVSYSREDSGFVLKLAGDLKAAGASVWLDQLDIRAGQRWDRAVEDALTACTQLVVIFSPASASSTNVMDEVSFALDEGKTVIPVIYRDCSIPFRLRRVQHVDLRRDYAGGLQELLKTLAAGQITGQRRLGAADASSQKPSSLMEEDRGQPPDESERQSPSTGKWTMRGRLHRSGAGPSMTVMSTWTTGLVARSSRSGRASND